MTVREQPWPTGAPAWVGLTCSDVGAATGFYGAVLGWEFEIGSTPDGRAYLLAVRDGRRLAGITQAATPGTAAEWLVYLMTPDAGATADRAEAAGAQVLAGPVGTDGDAAIAFLRDPTGAVLGLLQPGTGLGLEVTDEVGTVAWTELLTDDVPAAQEFYGAVLGVEHRPLEGEPGYLTVHAAGEVVCGLGPLESMDDGAGRSHWLTYLRVADVDATLRLVDAHGGRSGEPFDSPFGRIAVVRGPEGETFALIADAMSTDPGI